MKKTFSLSFQKIYKSLFWFIFVNLYFLIICIIIAIFIYFEEKKRINYAVNNFCQSLKLKPEKKNTVSFKLPKGIYFIFVSDNPFSNKPTENIPVDIQIYIDSSLLVKGNKLDYLCDISQNSIVKIDIEADFAENEEYFLTLRCLQAFPSYY